MTAPCSFTCSTTSTAERGTGEGYRVVRAQDTITFEKSVTAPAEDFYRKIRIACQTFNAHQL